MEKNFDYLIQEAAAEGDVEQVLKLYDELYQDDIMTPEDNWWPELTLTQKAGLLTEIGKFEEGLKIYRTILDMRLVKKDENSRSVLVAQQLIGGTLFCQNKFEDALDILNDTLEKQLELLGDKIDPVEPDLHETRLIIANVLESQGKLKDAMEVYLQAFKAFSEIFGTEVDITMHVDFIIRSLKLKMAAAAEGNTDDEDSADIDLDTILKIVDYGPSVLSVKMYGDDGEGKDTILHRAVKSNVEQIIHTVFQEIIKEYESDKEKLIELINFENSEIQTPLTLAVDNDCEIAVKYLLENGIEYGLDVNKITAFNKNALLLANYRCNESIHNLLLQYNAVLPDWVISEQKILKFTKVPPIQANE